MVAGMPAHRSNLRTGRMVRSEIFICGRICRLGTSGIRREPAFLNSSPILRQFSASSPPVLRQLFAGSSPAFCRLSASSLPVLHRLSIPVFRGFLPALRQFFAGSPRCSGFTIFRIYVRSRPSKRAVFVREMRMEGAAGIRLVPVGNGDWIPEAAGGMFAGCEKGERIRLRNSVRAAVFAPDRRSSRDRRFRRAAAFGALPRPPCPLRPLRPPCPPCCRVWCAAVSAVLPRLVRCRVRRVRCVRRVRRAAASAVLPCPPSAAFGALPRLARSAGTCSRHSDWHGLLRKHMDCCQNKRSGGPVGPPDRSLFRK